ncbi:MAG: hypothetical protein CBB71_06575 [Rhodopirellula sp. TMED11]|nr:MAG: hypothetical protein CBB71_06575 [Rhodopirellula sp. TMED11]
MTWLTIERDFELQFAGELDRDACYVKLDVIHVLATRTGKKLAGHETLFCDAQRITERVRATFP